MDRDFSQAAFPKTLRRSRSKNMTLMHMSFAIVWLTAFFFLGAPAAAQGLPEVSDGNLSVESVGANPCPDGESFQQGQQVRLLGDGFAGGAPVRLQFWSGDFFSDIGPTIADGTGEIDVVVTIPQGFPAPTEALIEADGAAPSGLRALDRAVDIGLPTTSDGDEDGVPDYCDNCPSDGNAGQEDDDSDGKGNICDSCPMGTDLDGDGLCSDVDPCPSDANNDIDGDGICGNSDNCPDDPNPDQADSNGNGIGDECEPLFPCADGIDNDADGLIDLDSDPGCSGVFDITETDPSLPCDDGIDNDGDVKIDFRPGGVGGDPGCRLSGLSPKEDPECDDGVDNDGDGAVDWDGDHDLFSPDPECLGLGDWDSEVPEPSLLPGLGAGTVLLSILARLRKELPRVRKSRRGLTPAGDGVEL